MGKVLRKAVCHCSSKECRKLAIERVTTFYIFMIMFVLV